MVKISLLTLLPMVAGFAAEVPKIDFARDIRPIFQEHCYECHGPSQQMRGLRLDRRSSAFQLRGGIVIGPGNSMGSRLFLRVSGTSVGTRMPPTGALSSEQINRIRNWIDQGAEWPDNLAGEKAIPPADPKAAQIMDALRRGDRTGFDRLIRDKAAINRPGTNADMPLMYVAVYGTADSLRKLLDAGADPNVANYAGATPLMWAIDDIEKVRLLLDHGANPDIVSDNGRTALQISIERRDGESTALLLLNRGAKLPVNGGSLAAAAATEQLLRAVIRKGASAKALEGGLPVAAVNGCDACLDLLLPLEEKPAIRNALEGADLGVSPAHLKRLLDSGADPNVVQRGKPLLMWLATKPSPDEHLRVLLERGATVNVKSSDGYTALDYALRQGDSSTATLLRKFGAVETRAPAASRKPDPAASARAALVRSMPILQRTSVTFMQKSGCVSCHNNNLLAMSIASLREKKGPFDETLARSQLKAINDYLDANRERYLEGIPIPGASDTTSYILAGLAAEASPPTAATDAMAHYLRGTQERDGSWRIVATRPPIESSSIEVTALSLRSLQVYAPASQRTAYQPSILRAAAWLGSAEPVTNEDRVYQLLGLTWAEDKSDRKRKLGDILMTEQRPDGGWAQLRSLDSDAYATGQALVALRTAGILSPSDPEFQRGVKFLLETQMQDGSWFVRSRAVALQPYFDSGFPYGTDQYISAAATNWASMALAATL
jgi:ankyrin repeat protein